MESDVFLFLMRCKALSVDKQTWPFYRQVCLPAQAGRWLTAMRLISREICLGSRYLVSGT